MEGATDLARRRYLSAALDRGPFYRLERAESPDLPGHLLSWQSVIVTALMPQARLVP